MIANFVVVVSFISMLLAPCVVALRASLKTDFVPTAVNGYQESAR